MGTKSVTFQSSKKSTCVKKKEKGDFLILSNFLILSTACGLQHKPLQQPMEEQGAPPLPLLSFPAESSTFFYL